MKLYTAEWKEGSRGWKLSDDAAQPYFEKCIELGITNIHVHKGPTIWPLDKDAFDVSDVDKVATRYQELNFIVEHVGLPRIEDFCFMATQERNVYAGLAVVVGALMHARPRFFAKVMGELLFWVGEDKMLFGADYAIWEPKWQVEGLVDWDYPDETYSDYPRLDAAGRKKILGLNAAKLYGVDVPGGAAPARRGARGAGGRAAGRVPVTADDVLAALGTVYDPELDEPITALRFVAACEVADDGRRERPPAPADAAVRAELRLPDGGRRARRGARAARRGRRHGRARGPLHRRGDQRRGRGRRRLRATPSPARRRASSTRCASCSAARRSSRARDVCCATVADPASARLGDLDGPDAAALPRAARASWASTRPTARRRSCAATARRSRRPSWRGSPAWPR